PTAMHIVRAHETPLRRASVIRDGVGPIRRTHADPSHVSIRGRPPADRAPRYGAGASSRPTAMHGSDGKQATDDNTLSTTGAGAWGSRAVQTPSASSVASGARTPCALPMYPTETHDVGVRHTTASGFVAIAGA